MSIVGGVILVKTNFLEKGCYLSGLETAGGIDLVILKD